MFKIWSGEAYICGEVSIYIDRLNMLFVLNILSIVLLFIKRF